MLFFLTKRRYDVTWRRCLEYSKTDPAIRREMLNRIRLLPYEKLFRMRSFPSGAYVFGDLDRLSFDEVERAAAVWGSLADAQGGVGLHNHPIRMMRRFELLRHLYEQKFNSFNAYRLADFSSGCRFPVFIRAENDHRGSITPLLHTKEDLEDAIENLIARGKSKENKIIIEYVDTTDSSGLHHRYRSVVARSELLFTFFERSEETWIVKNRGKEVPRSELEQVEPQLQEILQLANVDFGCIDYAIIDDRLEVFEINTNPTIWPPEMLLKISRRLDCSPASQHIPLLDIYEPLGKKPKSFWYWVGRALHRTLRALNLMDYEAPVVSTLRRLKRRVFG